MLDTATTTTPVFHDLQKLTCVLVRHGLAEVGDLLTQLHVGACCTLRLSQRQCFSYFLFEGPQGPIHRTKGQPSLLRPTSRCDCIEKKPGRLVRAH